MERTYRRKSPGNTHAHTDYSVPLSPILEVGRVRNQSLLLRKRRCHEPLMQRGVMSQHNIKNAVRPIPKSCKNRAAAMPTAAPYLKHSIRQHQATLGGYQLEQIKRNSCYRQEVALESQATCPTRKSESSAQSLSQRVAILTDKYVTFASSLNTTNLKLPLLRKQERKLTFKIKKKIYPLHTQSVFKAHFNGPLPLEEEIAQIS